MSIPQTTLIKFYVDDEQVHPVKLSDGATSPLDDGRAWIEKLNSVTITGRVTADGFVLVNRVWLRILRGAMTKRRWRRYRGRTAPTARSRR